MSVMTIQKLKMTYGCVDCNATVEAYLKYKKVHDELSDSLDREKQKLLDEIKDEKRLREGEKIRRKGKEK